MLQSSKISCLRLKLRKSQKVHRMHVPSQTPKKRVFDSCTKNSAATDSMRNLFSDLFANTFYEILTCSLSMKSIFNLTGRIYRCHFKFIYQKKKDYNFFVIVFFLLSKAKIQFCHIKLN